MRRRRTTTELGSLELLLDTICNTFGGIIFLAILVAVLLQFSGSSKRSDAKAKSPTTADQIAEEIETLRRTVARQDELLATLKSSAPPAPAGDVPKLRKQLAEATELLDAQRQIAALEKQLADDAKAPPRNLRLPMLHATTKTEVPTFLKAHRLTFLIKPDAARSINEAEFVIRQSDTGQRSISPKPSVGIALTVDTALTEQIAAALTGYNPANEHLAVFLWEDSFDVFPALRTVMVEKGFEYRLAPYPEEVNAVLDGASAGQVQ